MAGDGTIVIKKIKKGGHDAAITAVRGRSPMPTS